MNKPSSCCYNCEKRKVGCHSSCEDYKQFKINLEANNSARKKAKDAELFYDQVRYNNLSRTTKKRKGLKKPPRFA